MMKETKEFATESKELLNLMINSIYTNKDIFLRELISNASDAIDKYRFMALKGEANYPQIEHAITLVIDKKARSLSISDNGIGMDKKEVISDLGTIAKSGTKDFASKFKEAKEKQDLAIIGQFGVGFYSAFMVADKVSVLTKKPGEKSAYLFTSDGVKDYTVEEAEKASNGTTVTLYFKANEPDGTNYDNYLESYTLEELVKKYSDYIRYPIKMDVTESQPDLDKDGKPIEGKYHDVIVNKTLNSMVPLWKKNPKEVTPEMLNDFYKSKFDDYEEPLFAIPLHIEGNVFYDAILYIPSHAPYNLYSENYEKGLDLYSKGIFIQEKCKALVPDYLKFVKGLVDSDDFSLNISREMLQKSPMLEKIADSLEKKVIATLKETMEKDNAKYQKFFTLYGDHLKFGIYSSYGAKKDLLEDLLVYPSLQNETPISFKQYKEKMAKDQKAIYYASGKSLEAIKLLPQLEKYKKEQIDVLYFASDVDEFAVMMLQDYDKIPFKNIAEETKDSLTKEEQDKIDALKHDHQRALDDIKEALKGKVDDVSFSSKLVDSPVCIATKEGLSLNMENVLNEQQEKTKAEGEKPQAVKVLEINPDHDLWKAIAGVGDDDAKVKKYASLLYDEAMMLEGYEVKDKPAFVKNLNDLMLEALKK
jgi:molecular chaperone HtpG